MATNMKVATTPVATSLGPSGATRALARLLRAVATAASRVRVGGQLGPRADVELGRRTGARV